MIKEILDRDKHALTVAIEKEQQLRQRRRYLPQLSFLNPLQKAATALVIFLLLLTPLTYLLVFPAKDPGNFVDGNFADWDNIDPSIDSVDNDDPNPGLNLMETKVKEQSGRIGIYIQTEYELFTVSEDRTADGVYIFVDSGSSKGERYQVGNFQADYLISILGNNGDVKEATLLRYDPQEGDATVTNADDRERRIGWAAWVLTATIDANSKGNELECSIYEYDLLSMGDPAFLVVVKDSNGNTDQASWPVSLSGNELRITETTTKDPADLFAQISVDLETLEFDARGSFQMENLNFLYDIERFDPENGNLDVELRVQNSSRVQGYDLVGTGEALPVGGRFSVDILQPYQNSRNLPSDLYLWVNSKSDRQHGVLDIHLDPQNPATLSKGRVFVKQDLHKVMLNDQSTDSTITIDGFFGDWDSLDSRGNIEEDRHKDVGFHHNPNIDLGRYAATLDDNLDLSFMFSTLGDLMAGTTIPISNPGVGARNLSDQPTDLDWDEDGIPNKYDDYPLDHDNDGIPDEYDPDDDNDGKLDVWDDYPLDFDNDGVYGTMDGPQSPDITGNDTAYIYLDTGYPIPDLQSPVEYYDFTLGSLFSGADTRIVFTGRNGEVTSESLERWNPKARVWERDKTNPQIPVGTDTHSLETQLSLSTLQNHNVGVEYINTDIRVFFQLQDWEQNRDHSNQELVQDIAELERSGTRTNPANWWSNDWDYRKTVSVDSTYIDSNLSNFPMAVFLDSGNFDFSKAQSNGEDIRFTSTGASPTGYDYEIEYWDDTGEEAVVWVEVSSVSSSADTDLEMYYGNFGASDGQNVTGVWDSNFVMVQHLHETAVTTGTYNDHLDSTSNNNDVEVNGNPNLNATGQVDGGDDLNGTGDYLEAANSTSLDITGQITISLWVYATDYSNASDLVTKGNHTEAYSTGIRSAGTVRFATQSTNLTSTGTVTANTWTRLTFVKDSVGRKIYFGTKKDTSDNVTTAFTTTTTPLSISTGSYEFDGIVDELRISNTSRSAAWVKASYNSETDKLLSFATEELKNQAPTLTGGNTWPNPNDLDVYGTGTSTISSNFTDLDDPGVGDFTVTIKVRDSTSTEYTLVNNQTNGNGGLTITALTSNDYRASYTWDSGNSQILGDYDLYFYVEDGTSEWTEDKYSNNSNELTLSYAANNAPTLTDGNSWPNPSSVDRYGSGTTTISASFTDLDDPGVSDFTVTIKVKDSSETEYTLVNSQSNGRGGLSITDQGGNDYRASYTWSLGAAQTLGDYDIYFYIEDSGGAWTEDKYTNNSNELTVTDSSGSTTSIPIYNDGSGESEEHDDIKLWPVHAFLLILGFLSMLAAVLIAMNKKKVKDWEKFHQNLGLAGAGLGVLGLIMGIYMVEEATGEHFYVGHAYLGLVTILFAVTTPSLSFLAMRQKQHMKDLMLAHRWCGRITLLLMLITILSGLVVALG